MIAATGTTQSQKREQEKRASLGDPLACAAINSAVTYIFDFSGFLLGVDQIACFTSCSIVTQEMIVNIGIQSVQNLALSRRAPIGPFRIHVKTKTAFTCIRR